MTKMTKMQLSEPFNYEHDREYAKKDPISFWKDVADKYIHFDKPYDSVYSGNEMYPEWYKGGKLNTCYNILDVHVMNPLKRDKYAFIYECPFLNKTIKITYQELYEKVCEFSRVLLNLNVTKNDNVLIYMSNTIEGLISLLACTRIGATYGILVEGYSTKSLIERIEQLKPKVVLNSNFNITNNQIVFSSINLSAALKQSTFKPNHIITYNRYDKIVLDSLHDGELIPSIENSLDWDIECLNASINPFYDYTPVDSEHPSHVIYTSGTTGNSKAVVRDNAAYLAANKYFWKCKTSPIDSPTYLTYSSFGWVAFHIWFFSTMANGGTLVIFEGGIVQNNNDPSSNMWKKIEDHKVNFMFAVPRSFRFIIKTDPNANFVSKYDLSSLKGIWLCGEVVEKAVLDYIEDKIKINTSCCYGQTETGHINLFDLKPLGYDIIAKKPLNTTGKPLPSVNIVILSEDGKELGLNQTGHLAYKLPAPPGFALTLYNDDEKYRQLISKVPGYYLTGDMAFIEKSGYCGIVSRADDLLIINGHKIELSRIEESILRHPMVLECMAIGIKFQMTGHSPMALVILKEPTNLTQLKNEIDSIISSDIEPYAILKSLIVVYDLPRTKNGKLSRVAITNILNDSEYVIPNSEEDYKLLKKIQDLHKSNKSSEINNLKRNE